MTGVRGWPRHWGDRSAAVPAPGSRLRMKDPVSARTQPSPEPNVSSFRITPAAQGLPSACHAVGPTSQPSLLAAALPTIHDIQLPTRAPAQSLPSPNASAFRSLLRSTASQSQGLFAAETVRAGNGVSLPNAYSSPTPLASKGPSPPDISPHPTTAPAFSRRPLLLPKHPYNTWHGSRERPAFAHLDDQWRSSVHDFCRY